MTRRIPTIFSCKSCIISVFDINIKHYLKNEGCEFRNAKASKDYVQILINDKDTKSNTIEPIFHNIDDIKANINNGSSICSPIFLNEMHAMAIQANFKETRKEYNVAESVNFKSADEKILTIIAQFAANYISDAYECWKCNDIQRVNQQMIDFCIHFTSN